jgi:hypothetical protein
MPSRIKTHCLYHLAIPHYQKFVQKKLRTRRVINFEYQSFLILIGRIKIKATSHILVKNFRLGLFELLRLYRFLRNFKKKKLHFNFFRLKNLFLLLMFACLRLTAKDLFLMIKRFNVFLLKKGSSGTLKTKRLKKTEYRYFLNLRGLKTGRVFLL